MSKIIKTEICQQEEARLNACYKTALGVVTDVIGKEEIEEYLNGVILVKIVYNNPNWVGCARKYENLGYSIIKINHILLQFEDKIVVEVLIHEICHLFTNCRGHNYKWKYYINLINEKTEYNITEYFFDKRFFYYRRYNIICKDCGNIAYWRDRLHKVIKERVLSGDCICCLCGSHEFYIEDKIKGEAYSKERPY